MKTTPITPPEPKHIFIQVNTDNIIALYESGMSDKDFEDAVLEHTIIYDQGSMALGSPIVDFAIAVDSVQDVYFTILPLQLFSYDKVYFTAFNVESSAGIHIPDCKWEPGVLSFNVNTGSVEKDGNLVFKLVARIDYTRRGLAKSITINIDPVMRVRQR
ncbi:MAG: hypothetical protein V4581_16450 [Bacteroidota bacterium]